MSKDVIQTNKLKGFALLGAVIGLIGGICGIISIGLSLCDRFSPPSIEVLEVYPLCIESEQSSKYPYTPIYGISAIVHLRSKHRTVFISGLDLIGKKFLSPADVLLYSDKIKTGKISQDEINKHVQSRKPYIVLFHSGWPKESTIDVRLEPYQDKYIKFTFLEPRPFYYAKNLPEEYYDYVGFDDKTKKPTSRYEYPDLFNIFKLKLEVVRNPKDNSQYALYRPYDISNEIKTGSVNFQLRIGSKQLIIPSNKIRPFKRIKENDWNEKRGQELILEKTYS